MMRDLAFFRPSEELTLRLLNEGLNTPREGLHGTVLRFFVRGRRQPAVIRALSCLDTEPFEVEVTGVESYGLNGGQCFGLTLTRPQALMDLHTRMAESIRDLEFQPGYFDSIMRRYGGEAYCPHITIHYGSYIPELRHDYEGMKISVDKYYLVSRHPEGRNWFPVSSFKLGAPVLI